MRLPLASAALAILLLASSAPESRAVMWIKDDTGGQIGAYIDAFKKVRESGESVVIDGDCTSACTMVLGLVPPERLCVTPRARFGFHTAWKRSLIGMRRENAAGTEILWSTYPDGVRRWIVSKGGLSEHTLYLSGAELMAIVPRCR